MPLTFQVSNFIAAFYITVPWAKQTSTRRGQAPFDKESAMEKQGTALITGASSGIGGELAKIFAKDGYNLVLVARSEGKLKELAGELAEKHGTLSTIIPADLAKPSAGAAIAGHLDSLKMTVDVLVNNAGYGTNGPFAKNPMEPELAMIQVNILALTELTRRFLPGMIARGKGRILNVASTAAFQPGPFMAVYYATKAFVLSFSEAIAEELEGTGVSVTALCPGPTQSGFQAAAKIDDIKLFQSKWIPDSATVALAGYRALMSGKRVYIHGFANKVAAGSVRFVPRRMTTSLVRRLQEKRTNQESNQ
jgi:short-subunit dehydrogenase